MPASFLAPSVAVVEERDLLLDPGFPIKTRTTLNRRIADGSFPPPILLGRKRFWLISDIEACYRGLKSAAAPAAQAGS
jgi:hypothetical protein